MPFRKATCRQVTLPSRRTSPNALWITDDILSSALYRLFPCVHKRYESNVPGPLEAQRRLARRRMMGLATHGGGGGGVDPALLYGSRGPTTKSLEWEAPGKGRSKRQDVAKNKAGLEALDPGTVHQLKKWRQC